jgi:outer membrane protein
MYSTKSLNMKKLLLVAFSAVLFSFAASAQKYAIIDTKYILNKLPEYAAAEKRLEQLGMQWQAELDTMQSQLDKMYKNYDAEQYMLSDDLKKKRETELFNKEKDVRDLQKKRFGYEGDLFKERQKLVKPIQDKVYNAVQKLAIGRGYDFILDKSEGITVIFADPKLDKSEDILRELGIK